LKYLNYIKNDLVNGTGVRNVLWLSNCSHGCEGCFNEGSWKNVGEVVTNKFIDQVLDDLKPTHVVGITLSGGDPLHIRNFQGVLDLCRMIKRKLPDKTIWLYTGYTLEQLQSDLLRQPILMEIDTLIDGKYEKDKPTKKPFRGSSNQCIYELKDGKACVKNM
jgi:anaerobic ribonucleoside-triphosphate reductase activating protein